MYTPYKMRKELVLQKINLEQEDNSKYKNHLDKVFNDPNNYFTNNFNGNEVIIGKRHSNQTLDLPQYQSNRKSIYYLRSVRSQNSSKSVIKLNEGKSTINQGKPSTLPSNKRYIDDYEIKDLFDKYKTLKTENSIEESKNSNIIAQKLLSQFDRTCQKEVGQILHLQKKVLKTHEKNNKEINHIKIKLSKRLKRKEDELLMTTMEKFRIKKELRDICSQEIQSRNPKPLYKWVVNLRDNDKHYINFGSNKTPLWQLIIPKRNMNQTVRNPELNEKYCKTEIRFYENNQYLKHKLNGSQFYPILSKVSGYSLMKVKGEDLLQFEIDHTKNMKGRKIIPISKNEGLMNYKYDKMNNEEIFGANVNSKELLRGNGNTI